MENEEQVLNLLNKDKINNINAINFIKDYEILSTLIDGNSALISGRSDEIWTYIYANNEEQLRRLLDKNPVEAEYYAVVENWMIPILSKNRSIEWVLNCEKLILPENIVLSNSKYVYDSLKEEDAEYIYEKSKYKQFTSIEFIKDRIKKGISLCRREEGKPFVWIMTQDDGALGFLNVVEEHRKKGYARDICLAMIHKVRESKNIVFEHIEDSNVESMKLALSFGFQKYKTINWVKLKADIHR